MSQIINFKTKTDNVIDFLEEVKEDVKKNNINNCIIALKLGEDDEEGRIIVGHCNLDWGQRQELISHLQVDLINSMIKENYVTPD